jgi:hypothetical protein
MPSRSDKRLATNWFLGVPDDKKAELEQTLRASTTMKELLKKIVSQQIEEIIKTEAGTDQYSTPSWAYLQAHRNGQLGSLRGIMTLLDF